MSHKPRDVTPEDMAIGARIYEARIAAQFSQERLAEETGLSRQQIRKYECGEDRITGGRLICIARILNTPIAFFFQDVRQIMKQPMRQALTLQAAQFFAKIKSMETQQEALNFLKLMSLKEI